MKQETENQLMELINRKHIDPVQARVAWSELFHRHWEYLRGTLRYHLRELYDQAFIDDLIQQAFMVVYVQSHRFCPCESAAPADQRKYFRGWLGTIARHLFETSRRNRAAQNVIALSDEIVRTIEENQVKFRHVDPQPDSQLLSLVREALESLSERDRRILLLTADYFDSRKKQQRVAHKDLDELAQEFGVTTTNIRQIRKRSIEKVKNYISQKLTLSA